MQRASSTKRFNLPDRLKGLANAMPVDSRRKKVRVEFEQDATGVCSVPEQEQQMVMMLTTIGEGLGATGVARGMMSDLSTYLRDFLKNAGEFHSVWTELIRGYSTGWA